MNKLFSFLGSIIMFAGTATASEFQVKIGPFKYGVKTEPQMNKSIDIKKIDIKDIKEDNGTALNCGTTDCTAAKKK